MKYLEINVTKKVQDLYIENHRTSLDEIKEHLKWKDFTCS